MGSAEASSRRSTRGDAASDWLLPASIVVFGIGLSLAAWQALLAERRDHMLETTSAIAEGLGRTIGERLHDEPVDPVEIVGSLEHLSPLYALSLARDGEMLLSRGEPSGPAWWRAEARVAGRGGAEWWILVRPTRGLVEAQLTWLPHVVLLGGLVISGLVAGLGWAYRLARLRAEALGRANQELEEQVQATRNAEGEVRRLNHGLELRVEARTAELNEAITELEAFNYSVSHDLKSPVGAILNFAAILEEDYGDRLDAEGRDYLRRIARSAQASVEMLEALLAFSRLGRGQLQSERVDMAELARSIFEELRSLAGERPVDFELAPLPPVQADPAMMRVVLTNLLSNAVKFTRDRPHPRILVGGAVEDASVHYFVQDNGVGFDAGLAHKLFGVFERLHSKERFEGHGVGLATVARIVRRHGGRVWAEGEPDKGATFHVSLPLRPAGATA